MAQNKDLSAAKQMVQCVKKVMFDSPGLVDFTIGLVNSVLNLPKGQVKEFGKFKLQKNCNQCYTIKNIFELIKTLLGLYILATTCPNGKW